MEVKNSEGTIVKIIKNDRTGRNLVIVGGAIVSVFDIETIDEHKRLGFISKFRRGLKSMKDYELNRASIHNMISDINKELEETTKFEQFPIKSL